MTLHLVGAGPGDPDLLTVRALRLLQRADVVVHDRLLSDGVLDLIPAATLRIDVGKVPGGPSWSQDDINTTLIHYARRHPTVVRLKGGDPYVFGRGGEEALAARQAGLDVAVVPGITSAVAAASAAGVPVTHRGTATGFTVVTASTAADSEATDWLRLAQLDHTLVILMGVRHARRIAGGLIEGGRSPQQPVVVIAAATSADQRVVRTTLAELGTVDVAAPATIVVGDVAALDGLPTWASHHAFPQTAVPLEGAR